MKSIFLLYVFVILAFIASILYGWVMNIVTLLNGGYEQAIELVVSIVGIIVVPVGALTYYIVG